MNRSLFQLVAGLAFILIVWLVYTDWKRNLEAQVELELVLQRLDSAEVAHEQERQLWVQQRLLLERQDTVYVEKIDSITVVQDSIVTRILQATPDSIQQLVMVLKAEHEAERFEWSPVVSQSSEPEPVRTSLIKLVRTKREALELAQRRPSKFTTAFKRVGEYAVVGAVVLLATRSGG